MKLTIEYISIDALEPYERNSRKHDYKDIESIKASIEQFGFSDPIGIWSDHNVIVEGHGRFEAAKALGMKQVPVIRLDHMTDEQRRAYAIAHNKVAELSEWDFSVLDSELAGITEIDMSQFGFYEETGSEEAELERKKKEFEDRMAAGELSDDDPEYQEFLQKFEAKKTTDDCYTPPKVYDAVADYVTEKYGIKKTHFVRPFVPGGDYQRYQYKPSDVVVDNPPFSILAEICEWYKTHGIKYFLFCPALTPFSSSSGRNATVLCVGVGIIYENGAAVNTSFITNLDPPDIRFRSAPDLYARVTKAVDEIREESRREIPKYSYPPYVISAPMLTSYSRYGIDFSVKVSESYPISELDAQKESKKSIYGKGYLISEAKKAEREKAEREKAIVWELSEREKEIIRNLG